MSDDLFDTPRARAILRESDFFTQWIGGSAHTTATHRPTGVSVMHPSPIVVKQMLIDGVDPSAKRREGVSRWPHVDAHPALANEIAYALIDASDGYVGLHERYGAAEILLAAGWRPVGRNEK